MKKLLLLLVMSSAFFGLIAQPKMSYRVTQIDDLNGLPDKNIEDFVFDKFGFLWVASEGNLVRYAYKNSVIFNHHTNSKFNSENFHDLLSVDSTIWTFSGGDLYGIDIVDMDVQQKSLDPKYGHITSFVLCPDAVSIIISTDRGYLLKYNTKRNQFQLVYLFNEEILKITFFNKYTIFLFMHGVHQLVQFDLNLGRPVSTAKDVYVNIWSHFENIETIGRCFVAGNSVLRLNHQKDIYDSVYNFPMELRDVKADKKKIYFLTTKNKLFEKDIKSGRTELMYDGDANEIKSFKLGESGILYLVSRNGLIILKKIQPFDEFKEYEPKPIQKVRRRIVEDPIHKRLFFLTYNGVYVYNQNTERYESYIDNILNAYNACIDNMYMYVTTEGAGIFRIRLSDLKVENLYSYKDNAENDVAVQLLKDGNLLLGWYKGLKILNLKTHTLKYISLSYKGTIYDNLYVSTILQKNSNEWWVATSRGIFVLDGDLKVVRRYASNERSENKISSDYVNTIYFNKNGCFAALTDDLIFIPFDHGSIQSFLLAKNYAANKIVGILGDKHGRIWFSSYNGLYCLDLKTHSINAFHAPDYFKFDEFNKTSYLYTQSGKMFFGTISEYFSFDPLEYQSNKVDYKLNVNTIKAFDKDKVKIAYNIQKGGVFELPSASSNLNVTFVFQNHFTPEKVRYFYKIEGLTDKWVSLENLSNLQLFAIPSGSWRIDFKAVNAFDMTSAETFIMISVPTVYYKTIWFAILLVIAVFFLGYLFYLNRINNFKRILLFRKEMSDELHDSVGTAVTKSILVAEAIKRETGTTDNRLQQIIDYGKQVNSNFRDVLWSLEQNTDQILNLFDRINEIGNAAVENTAFEFIIIRNNVDDHFSLKIRQKRELLMITREAIHNVLKHSKGNMIVFEFNIVNGRLNLQIRDNGKNESEELQFSGMGLESIKLRVSKIGGTVSFRKHMNGFDIDISV